MKVKDIMEPIKDYLSPDETLKDAVAKMKVARRGEGKVGVKGIVVIDESEKLIGIVSIKDVLKAIVPAYLSLSETDIGVFTWEGMLIEMIKKAADKKVKDIMTTHVFTVPENAPLMECADFIVKHNLQRIPVVNKEKKLIGIVYIRDLYYAIVKALLEEEV